MNSGIRLDGELRHDSMTDEELVEAFVAFLEQTGCYFTGWASAYFGDIELHGGYDKGERPPEAWRALMKTPSGVDA